MIKDKYIIFGNEIVVEEREDRENISITIEELVHAGDRALLTIKRKNGDPVTGILTQYSLKDGYFKITTPFHHRIGSTIILNIQDVTSVYGNKLTDIEEIDGFTREKKPKMPESVTIKNG